MSAFRCSILFLQFIFISVCFCEIIHLQENKYLSNFVEFLNKVPNTPYFYENGVLLNAKRDGENVFTIVTKIKAKDIKDSNNEKYVKCRSIIIDDGDEGIVVQNDYHCTDVVDDDDRQFAVNLEEPVRDPVTSTETVYQKIQSLPLDNEVQPSDVVSSVEQYAGFARKDSADCIRCATHMDPKAEGVIELAELGIKHLDKHEPNVKHTLHTVNDVERQVQTVNGVRYILTLEVNYNNCTLTAIEECTLNKICQITILEKSWTKLSSGLKYRAILANNCTGKWVIGDDGEILLQHEFKNKENHEVFGKSTDKSNDNEIFKKQTIKLDKEENEHSFITEKELKQNKKQIIPLNGFNKDHFDRDNNEIIKNTNNNLKHRKIQAILKKDSKSAQKNKKEFIQTTESIYDEKKKVIDDLIFFFNFAGFDTKSEKDTDDISRMKRSFDSDLQVMSLQEKFYKLKNHLTNAKVLYSLGQVLVDYLNEMDMEVKTRVLNEILAAEEEYEGNQNFFYIKARINIPCEKAECFTNDTETKICNSVLENSNPKNPKVLTAFCYKDGSKISQLGAIKDIPLDDLILLKTVNEAVKRIENDLANVNALKPTKILSATTQRVSGILTKISMILEYSDCNITVPIVLRENRCRILEHLGSKICTVEVLERHWIKEKKLTYNCIERPIDLSFSESKVLSKKKVGSVVDPIALDIAQDALQYLETESNVNKRQTILKIQSVTTQVLAGMLTEVEFIVGYTDCEYNLKYPSYAVDKSIKDCKLVQNQQLRVCRAQVWERPWLQDDTQFNVTCKFDSSDHNRMSILRKEKPLELDIPRQRNPNDPKYYKLAEKSLKQYLVARNINQHHEILKIEQVTTQKVSGILTKIKFVISPTNCSIDPNGIVLLTMNCVASDQTVQCTANIMERPWIDSILMQANCTEISDIASQDPKIEQDPNNIKYKKIAEKSLKKYIKKFGITKFYQVLEVLRVTTQIVSGHTNIEFNIVPTSCEMDTNAEPISSTCYVESTENIIHCKSVILKKNKLNNKDIDITCDIKSSKLREKEEQINNITFTQMAEESLRQYVTSSGITQFHIVCSIVNVTTQIVSGKLTKIHFKSAPTNCDIDKKGEPITRNCAIETSNNNCHIECYSEVLEQPWSSKKGITVYCKDKNKPRVKRDVKNEVVQKDARDAQYKVRNLPNDSDLQDFEQMELAKRSLQQYLKSSEDYYVTEITSVKRIDTATLITFHALPENCKLPQNVMISCENDKIKCLATVIKINRKLTVHCFKMLAMIKIPLLNEVDVTNTNFKVYAQTALQAYFKASQIKRHHEIVSVFYVTSESVPSSSSNREFEVYYKISPTNCTLDSSGQTLGSNCKIFNDSEFYDCISLIKVNQAEENIITKTDCNPNTKHNIEKNVTTDSDLIKLAQESLKQYIEQFNIKTNYIVKRVISSAHTILDHQFRMEFEIFPTNCLPGPKCAFTSTNCKADDEHTITCYADILKNKINQVNCDDNRVTKFNPFHIAGGIVERDPSDPIFKSLAQKALLVFAKKTGSSKLLVVKQVLHATTQFMSGISNIIEFVMFPTDCSINADDPLYTNCKPNTSTSHKCQCTVIQKPWIQLSYVFSIGCTGGSDTAEFSNALDEKESTLTTTNNDKYIAVNHNDQNLPGSSTNEDPNNLTYKTLAKESLEKYVKDSGNSRKYEVVKVTKVTSQIVSGTIARINFEASAMNCQEHKRQRKSTCEVLNCHSEIYVVPWENKRDISVNCDIMVGSAVKHVQNASYESQEYINDDEKSSRLNREFLRKASKEQLSTNIKFKILAEESLQKYLQKSRSSYFFKITEILRASTHMVAGTLTSLDFKISPTNCLLNVTDKSSCTAVHSTVYRCLSNIWEKSLLNDDEKLISVQCKNIKNLFPLNEQNDLNDVNHKIERLIRSVQPSMTKSGAPQEQDASLLKFRKLAKESLNKYITKKRIAEPHEVVKVNKVVKKVVSGFIFDIHFTAMPKSCYQNSSCLQLTTLMLKCNSEIWDRPWLKRKDIKVSCRKQEVIKSEISLELVDKINNNSVPVIKDTNVLTNISEKFINRLEEYREVIDKSAKKYTILAEQALRKYERTTLFAYLYKITDIHRVRERVVGDSVNVEFSALLTDCQGINFQIVDERCKIQEPEIGIRCKAEISTLIPKLDKIIEIKCKNKRSSKRRSVSLSTTESKQNKVVVTRERRQLLPDDDYIEEDIKYYYAERAIYDYNKRSGTNNLFKVVTIHDTERSYHMKTLMYRIYLEIAMTYCMRHGEEHDIQYCDEIEPLTHKLCLARIYPSPDDEMIVRHVTIVCNDDADFQTITGLSVKDLVKASIAEIEKSPDVHYRLAHQGEANLIPSLTYTLPMRLSFLAVTTNCTKDVDLVKHAYRCWVDDSKPSKLCTSYIYMIPNTRNIHHIDANCRKPPARTRREISTNPVNATIDDLLIQQMVQEAIEKLEMSSLQRYKQRVLLINSYSTKIITGKVTTIDFDVGYTNCLKFEWVENITTCEFIEHLPRRHCVAKFFERLWTKNSRSIDVNCEDDETPLEAHIEFESAENAMHLAREAIKHIEAKYPSPQKQKVVRIFSLEKQTIAGLHYRMKIEVGLTDCVALSIEEDCKLLSDSSSNKFCRINVWVRPWTDHPPSYRVSCDYQEGRTTDIYHEMQAEHLFFDFLTKYKPNYANDFVELKKRYEIFSNNIKKIHELNIYERGTAKYAVTRFADLTYEEFRENYLGLNPSLRDSNHSVPMADIPKVELPDKFDWRDFDAVTEVKDQGACGSCWAFSVTGNIEGQWKMQSGQLVSLSEQELVDCDTLDNGCSGGLPDNAYRAIENLGGLEAENDYPYEGVNDKCSYNKTLSKVQISGAVNISSNETEMAKWLVQNGPISIGINANAMQFYVGGVSHPWKMLCNPENLDHGVLIVGYGVKDYPLFHKRLPYWIIKNSWGARWGEQGYYRVYRGDGTCGVNKMASSAVI